MRPVNLIPPEERRGQKAPTRTGPLAYVVVAVLAVALFAVTAVVLTNNKVSDRKAEKASLESQVAQAQAEATRLKSFADFATVQQARQATVTSLAQSRFDWERVLRELAIVLPSDVWLTNVTATATPDVQIENAADVTIRDTVAGPALAITGCAASHDSVARFLASLRDIDGVTRVTVAKDERPELSAASSTSSSGQQASAGSGVQEDCRTRDFISQFEVVAAFDAAPVPAAADAAAATPGATTTPATGTTTTAQPTTSASPADQSQVASGQQQLSQQQQSSTQQTQKARKDVGTFVPGTASTP